MNYRQHQNEPYCGECRRQCDQELVDFGNGPYEFWGRKGVDVNKQWVSKCCEAELFEDPECTVPWEEYEPEPRENTIHSGE